MAGLDDLFAQIPVQDIASKLGADEGEVNNAIRTLVPALVGGLQQNVAVRRHRLERTRIRRRTSRASGLLDGGVNVDQVDEKRGRQARRAASSAATTATPSPPRWPAAAQAAAI